LYYYGARYYDSTIGRFISADTFVQRTEGIDIVSSPLSVNLIMEGLGTALCPRVDYPTLSLHAPVNPQSLNRYSYVQNNPLRYTDPHGWDTNAHGFNLSLGFGAGFSFEILRVTDDRGNSGWTITLSFIGTTPNASVGYQYQHTNATLVNNLAGWSGGGGGSIGAIPWYLPSGGEYLGYKKDSPNGWQGFNSNAGPQAAPIEVHGTVGYTWVVGVSHDEPLKDVLPYSDTVTPASPFFPGVISPVTPIIPGFQSTNEYVEWENMIYVGY
jgi:hypothetical protein